MSNGNCLFECSKEIFGFAKISFGHGQFHCKARDPWTWRWRKVTRVIPYALEFDGAALPQDGQHVGPANSSLSYAY